MSTGSVHEGLGDLVTARDKRCKVAVTVPVLQQACWRHKMWKMKKSFFPCKSSHSSDFYAPSFGFISAVCLLVDCLTSQQQASVSQGRICSDNFTCCHTEIQVADQTFHLTQSQYTDTRPTSPSADPITPGAWQGSHWSANV